MDYIELINYCYNEYKESWCESHGYNISEYVPEIGFGGECFVCLSEFEKWEFQDEDYMQSLLKEEIFNIWKFRNELKEKMVLERIKHKYEEQK